MSLIDFLHAKNHGMTFKFLAAVSLMTILAFGVVTLVEVIATGRLISRYNDLFVQSVPGQLGPEVGAGRAEQVIDTLRKVAG